MAAPQVLHGGSALGALVVRFSWGVVAPLHTRVQRIPFLNAVECPVAEEEASLAVVG
jgi:hypothetical protein